MSRVITKKLKLTMKKKFFPIMGKERSLMEFKLLQVKATRGVTTDLATRGGINGKWLNPEMAYNIDAIKMLRADVYKAARQSEDEFVEDARGYYKFLAESAKKYAYELGLTVIKRPPWIRRPLWRRYSQSHNQ